MTPGPFSCACRSKERLRCSIHRVTQHAAKEDEAENKHAPLITELEGKLADEQNHLKHAKETIHEQQEVQQKMVEEHAKKVKASEDEAKYWKQRYKAYEEFAIDFAKLTAPWGQTEWHGEEGSAGTNADKGLDMQ